MTVAARQDLRLSRTVIRGPREGRVTWAVSPATGIGLPWGRPGDPARPDDATTDPNGLHVTTLVAGGTRRKRSGSRFPTGRTHPGRRSRVAATVAIPATSSPPPPGPAGPHAPWRPSSVRRRTPRRAPVGPRPGAGGRSGRTSSPPGWRPAQPRRGRPGRPPPRARRSSRARLASYPCLRSRRAASRVSASVGSCPRARAEPGREGTGTRTTGTPRGAAAAAAPRPASGRADVAARGRGAPCGPRPSTGSGRRTPRPPRG